MLKYWKHSDLKLCMHLPTKTFFFSYLKLARLSDCKLIGNFSFPEGLRHWSEFPIFYNLQYTCDRMNLLVVDGTAISAGSAREHLSSSLQRLSCAGDYQVHDVCTPLRDAKRAPVSLTHSAPHASRVSLRGGLVSLECVRLSISLSCALFEMNVVYVCACIIPKI